MLIVAQQIKKYLAISEIWRFIASLTKTATGAYSSRRIQSSSSHEIFLRTLSYSPPTHRSSLEVFWQKKNGAVYVPHACYTPHIVLFLSDHRKNWRNVQVTKIMHFSPIILIALYGVKVYLIVNYGWTGLRPNDLCFDLVEA